MHRCCCFYGITAELDLFCSAGKPIVLRDLTGKRNRPLQMQNFIFMMTAQKLRMASFPNLSPHSGYEENVSIQSAIDIF